MPREERARLRSLFPISKKSESEYPSVFSGWWYDSIGVQYGAISLHSSFHALPTSLCVDDDRVKNWSTPTQSRVRIAYS